MSWFKKGPKREVLWYPLNKKGELVIVVNWLATIIHKVSRRRMLTGVSWSVHYPPEEEIAKGVYAKERAPVAVMRIVLHWEPEFTYTYYRYCWGLIVPWKTVRPFAKLDWTRYWGLVMTRWLSRIIERRHKVLVRYTLTTPIVRKEENEESLEEK